MLNSFAKTKKKYFMTMIIILMIPSIMWFVFYLINKMESWDYKNSSSFECGFETLFNSRYSYSMPYLLMMLIFLFLDLEFCLILPYFLMNTLNYSTMNLLITLTMLVIMGLLWEWYSGSMNWME